MRKNLLKIAAAGCALCLLCTTVTYADPFTENREVTVNVTGVKIDLNNPPDPLELHWALMGIDSADMKGHWAERLFYWATRHNIIEGYPDGTIRPDQPMTEAEFLKTFYRPFLAALTVGKDWTESLYRHASSWKHPVSGGNNTELRHAPISRRKAAEIIAAAQGVRYSGDDAIVYLLGNRLAAGKKDATLEGFAGDDLLTRAEAVQWIRTLKLRGMFKIKEAPEELSDPERLPVLPEQAEEELPDFAYTPVTIDDFHFTDMDGNNTFELGATKESIDNRYGAPDEYVDFLQVDVYGSLYVHYDANGKMEAWKVDNFTHQPKPIRTHKGIVVGESSLSDLLRQYGTAGMENNNILSYVYEEVDGQFTPRFTAKEIIDKNNAIILSFIINEDTLKVDYIFCSRYPYAYFDFSNSN